MVQERSVSVRESGQPDEKAKKEGEGKNEEERRETEGEGEVGEGRKGEKQGKGKNKREGEEERGNVAVEMRPADVASLPGIHEPLAPLPIDTSREGTCALPCLDL